VELEKRGIPVVDIGTEDMHEEAVFRATGLGMPSLALVSIPPEMSQADLPAVFSMADAAIPSIVSGLTRPAVPAPVKRSAEPKTIKIKVKKGGDVLEKWFRYAEKRKWTDGLPLTPPTAERVKWMLTGTRRPPDEKICDVPPFFGAGTVEKIAINAVMAGAKPEYLETIIACVDAFSDPAVHMAGAIATTDPGNAQMIVINGPIVNRLGLNSSWSVMGPGWRSNSTIGRAVSLCLRNIGGADTPGDFQQHVYFLPADYSRVLAQSYPDTPGNWKLLSEQLGFRRDQNVVWCMPADVPINVSPFDSPTQPISAQNLLKNWVYQMAQQMPRRAFTGLVNFAPEHVRILAAEGWTDEDVRSYLFFTSFTEKYLEVKAEGFTNRGPLTLPPVFGLSRTPITVPPVDDCIIFGENPVTSTFILTSGAPVGGHGFFLPVSSHGIWAAREIGTLAPPPDIDRSVKFLREGLIKEVAEAPVAPKKNTGRTGAYNTTC
jgi:hypothetical protein